MKVRRITLLVLVALTALLVLQGWSFGVGKMFPSQSPLIVNWESPGSKKDATKEQEFINHVDHIKGLAIDHEFGKISIQGTTGNEIRVVAEIGVIAENTQKAEELLAGFSIKETLVENTLSYELVGLTNDQTRRGIEVNYLVEIPEGLELDLKQRYGVLRIKDVEAKLLQYKLRYGTVTVENLVGNIEGVSDFSSIDFKNVGGSIQLQDNFSSINLSLKDDPRGYDFLIDQNYGSLTDDFKLERKTVQNQLEAKGQYGAGINPIRIKSNFSTITLQVE